MASVHRIDLLRHAKSSWDFPSLPDRERPLAQRGIKATRRLSGHLRESRFAPDLVLCSAAVRAVQTLDGIREALPAETSVEIEVGLYEAGADDLLQRLNRLPEPVDWTLLIGHNPALEGLAIGLCGDGEPAGLQRLRAKYPTGGLATLSFAGPWSGLDWELASLEAFVVPREL